MDYTSKFAFKHPVFFLDEELEVAYSSFYVSKENKIK